MLLFIGRWLPEGFSGVRIEVNRSSSPEPVAPFAVAWIETFSVYRFAAGKFESAPLGVWIETLKFAAGCKTQVANSALSIR